MTLRGTLLLFLLLIVISLQARQQGGSVTGQVIDSITGKPVEFATVVLMQAADRKAVAHTLADSQGGFNFGSVAFGSYQIGITMLGYTPRMLDSFRVDAAHLTHRLGIRYLSQTMRQLGGVTVTGKKPLIELEDEKLIYNVENDIEKDNSSASDIMRKIPFVTVDADGTIKLKGQTNYKVLLNGKATSMITRDPKEALKAYPASIIKRIEIITEPSAKYDAEGIGGIINIITQKHTIGYNGSLFSSYNTLGRFNGGGSFSARKKKVGITAYVSGSSENTRFSSSIIRESFIPGSKGRLEQNTETRKNSHSLSGSLELTYDIDSSNSIGISTSGTINRSTGRMPQDNYWYDSTNQLIQTGIYQSDNYNPAKGVGTGVDYQHKFKQPGHELSFVLYRISGSADGHTDNTQHNDPGTDSFYRNNNVIQNRLITLQADYTLPLPHDQQLETGIKGTFQHTENTTTQIVRNSQGDTIPNPERNNIFNTRLDILALYITYRFKIGSKISVKPGTRLEQTYQTGDFISNKTTISSNYLSLVPTLNITWQMETLSTLSLSYSRRLQRPEILSLNPYINDNDPYNITYGNPNLKPSYANSFGLYLNKIMEKLSLTSGIDYTFTNNSIQNVISVDGTKGITRTTYDNIGKSKAAGVNLGLRFALTKKWNVSTNGRVSYTDFNNGSNLHSSGFSCNVYMNTDYNFGHDFRGDAYGYFYSSSPSLQGSSGSNIGYGFTLRKDLLNKKLSLTLSADQPFRKQRPLISEIKDASFHRVYTANFPANSYSFSISWRFGKLTNNATRKSTIDTGIQ